MLSSEVNLPLDVRNSSFHDSLALALNVFQMFLVGHAKLVREDDVNVLECGPWCTSLREAHLVIFIDLKIAMDCSPPNGPCGNSSGRYNNNI